MTKKILKELVKISYKGDSLNPDTVEQIAKRLKRQQLKQYIKALKSAENKKTVIVSLPQIPTAKEKEIINAVYPEKKIVYDIDPSLILGVRIIDNDLVYESNLRNSFKNIISYLSQQ